MAAHSSRCDGQTRFTVLEQNARSRRRTTLNRRSPTIPGSVPSSARSTTLTMSTAEARRFRWPGCLARSTVGWPACKSVVVSDRAEQTRILRGLFGAEDFRFESRRRRRNFDGRIPPTSNSPERRRVSSSSQGSGLGRTSKPVAEISIGRAPSSSLIGAQVFRSGLGRRASGRRSRRGQFASAATTVRARRRRIVARLRLQGVRWRSRRAVSLVRELSTQYLATPSTGLAKLSDAWREPGHCGERPRWLDGVVVTWSDRRRTSPDTGRLADGAAHEWRARDRGRRPDHSSPT